MAAPAPTAVMAAIAGATTSTAPTASAVFGAEPEAGPAGTETPRGAGTGVVVARLVVKLATAAAALTVQGVVLLGRCEAEGGSARLWRSLEEAAERG